MKYWLLVACWLLCIVAGAQEAHLQLIHNGKIKRRLHDGVVLRVTTFSGDHYLGMFRIINDSSFLIGPQPVSLHDVKTIYIPRLRKKQPFNWELFGYATMGVAISTAGMTLSKWEKFPQALAYSTVLGYSPYLFNQIGKISLRKRRFRFKKYHYRIWSIEKDHLVPSGRPF